MASGGTTTASPTTTGAATPSAWDCFWHPIDCGGGAEIAAAGHIIAGATTGVLTEGHRLTDTALHLESGASDVAMWTAIGIAAAAVAVIAIAIVAVYAFHRI